MILDNKIDEILHLDYKYLHSKTSTKVFETELNEIKPKPSFDLTSKPVIFKPFVFECSEEPFVFDCLEDHPIDSFEYK